MIRSGLRTRLAQIGWHGLFAVVVCAVLARHYFDVSPNTSTLGWSTLIIAMASTIISIVAVACLLSAMAATAVRWLLVSTVITTLMLWAVTAFIYVDTIIYRLYARHVDGFVINLSLIHI